MHIRIRLVVFFLIIYSLRVSSSLSAQNQNIADSIWAYRQSVENKITLLKNTENSLPIKDLEQKEIVIVEKNTSFSYLCQRYTPLTAMELNPNTSLENKKNTTTILAISEQVPAQTVETLIEKSKTKSMIGIFFTTPSYLLNIKNLDKLSAVILSYANDTHYQDLTAQAIFGAIPFKGKLEEDLVPHFKKGDGIETSSLKRLKYTLPEEVGIRSGDLKKVDSIATAAIQKKTTPSVQLLVAKDGKVFYHKAFGYQTYDSTKAANVDDIYDLASVSKISTAIPALMKLTDEGKFSVDKTLGDYYPQARKSNKKDMVIRQILTHQAGLRAWIPFWQNATLTVVANPMSSSNMKILDPKVFQSQKSRRFPYQVAENLFIHKKYYQKSIVKQILASPVAEKKDYVYSDLSYYLYPEVIKRITKKDVITYLDENFYKPLGAGTLTYNPLQKFDKNKIVPTEYDSLFRKQLIHGYVHDEGAAMLGGVSTHAGLFGNSNDLAKLLQMYLQNGYYGGKQYISPETLAEFTRCQFCPSNLRGIGFDRQRGTNAAKSVSEQSYGHSGFTGNLVWIDPANGLLYIFLSNRVYPTRNNTSLYDLNIRTNIQEVFYEALKINK
jgi:CubicO group peptidase (beta-lactamase class C family)